MSNLPENKDSSQIGMFIGFSHVTWYVGNAKQAVSYFKIGMGFKPLAFRDLCTGSRNICAYAVSNGKATFLFISVLRNPDSINSEDPEKALAQEIAAHVTKHGDGVKDVAFEVSDVESIYENAVRNGAKSIQGITEISDENGSATLAVLSASYGDTTHTLVQKDLYTGPFLPGYATSYEAYDRLGSSLPPVHVMSVDHCVANQDWNYLEKSCQYYEKMFGFHRFWSADSDVIHTQYSALSSIVMASPENEIKIPINEPAKGKRKSQIEEFVEYYDGPGVQHIALQTKDILQTVPNMRARGVEFVEIPASYYKNLRMRLRIRDNHASPIKESIDELEKNGILIDFDDQGYLLQLFTAPCSNRPTIFIEIIQREGHDGFGSGNFKSLFEAIEQEQRKRGNL